jgi:hypothetical protein
MKTNPEFEFKFDIIEWLKNTTETSLEKYRIPVPQIISFQLTQKQFQSVQDTLNTFGDTMVGKSKALRMISTINLWRRPIIKESIKLSTSAIV